ncbi:MAG: hypothetical protein Q7S27_00620 [Nanoarchaeota archaeon]|nr:hypothetical protein [Nanoarchaeota archaeon]
MKNEISKRKEKIATRIYNTLQIYKGKACLTGFYNGDIIYQNSPSRRIEIYGFRAADNFFKKSLLKRGFTQNDLRGPVVTLIEKEFNNPQWPDGKFIREPILRYYNIGGKGKVFGSNGSDIDDEKFQPANLNERHIGALEAIIKLSQIPYKISENFENYDEFKETLGDRFDPVSIDFVDWCPQQILYNEGLGEFVNAISLKETGKLDQLDTSSWKLKDSLDPRDHFKKLFETLKKYSSH